MSYIIHFEDLPVAAATRNYEGGGYITVLNGDRECVEISKDEGIEEARREVGEMEWERVRNFIY